MQLKYSDAKRSGKLNTAIEVICAAILGFAAFYMFISMFGLRYGADSMFEGSVTGGISGVWNSIADKLGTLDYIILPKYSVEEGAGGRVEYGFALTLILLAMAVVSYLVIKSRLRILLLIFVIPAAFMMLSLGLRPSVYAGMLFAFALITALTLMNVRGNLKPEYFIVPAAAFLICTALIMVLEQTVTLGAPKALTDYGASLKESIETMNYGSDPLPQGNVGALSGKELKEARGDINEIRAALAGAAGFDGEESKDKDKDAALTVKMSEPESLYLRGFIGADYRKNRWNTLSNSTFYGMRDKQYWLNRKGFDGLSELSYASELGGTENKAITVSVDVKDASRKIAFTPYELDLKVAEGDKARASEMVLPEGTKNYGGSYLGTKGFRGKQSYTYTTSQNITGEWTDAVGRLYTAEKSEETEKYFISESHYNVMQYDNYLDLPDKYTELFKAEVGETGDISENHADYKDTIETITNYLRNSYIYTDTFKPVAGGKDLVETIVSSKKGCDAHFATLATLLFRYYGIPARYVEGYLITPGNIAGKAGETEIAVSKQANHAWTEIYIDGFGWVPFEATSEYTGIMKEADLTKGLQNVDYENTQENNRQTKKEETEEDENEDKDGLKELLLRVMIFLLAFILAVILLVLLVLAIMKIVEFVKWRRAFSDKDPKAGIRALYQYSAVKKWKLAERGENIGLRAAYSQEEFDEADRAVMRVEVQQAKDRAKKERAAEKQRLAKEKAAEPEKGKGAEEK